MNQGLSRIQTVSETEENPYLEHRRKLGDYSQKPMRREDTFLDSRNSLTTDTWDHLES